METNFLKEIDKTWTLFLDRDGVLNEEIKGDYVRNIEQLQLYSYIPVALTKCKNIFAKIIVVTNQRGIGKGFYTANMVDEIHAYLNSLCFNCIDNFYFSPALDKSHHTRKPNIGMALQAKQENPNIDFSKSIMIGNNISDMEFGRNAGMKTIFVQTTQTLVDKHPSIDMMVENVQEFVTLLLANK